MMEDLFLVISIKNSSTVRVAAKLIGTKSNVEKELLLILDTGATHTAINRSDLEYCGYSNYAMSKNLKQTATGIQNFQTCVVKELHIGSSFKVCNMQVDVLDFGKDSKISGVLGMDFIKQITTIISREHKKILLTNKNVPELFGLFTQLNFFG